MPPRLRRVSRHSCLYSPASSRKNVSVTENSFRPFSCISGLQTRQRKSMWMWMATIGKNFRDPLPGSTNYLGAYNFDGELKRAKYDQDDSSIGISSKEGKPLRPEMNSDLIPFPQNKAFHSERVVNETMREDIWEKVMKNGQSVKTVSAQFGVEMSRIGAIVRLKEIEKKWILQGKRFAKPYAKAVMAMLPQTQHPQKSTDRIQPHESINDLPVHVATTQQIFHPTSESREFTRADAAKVFDERLLPADQRVPHPELAELEKDRLAGIAYEERVSKAAERHEQAEQKKLAADHKRKMWEEKNVKIASGSRWDFRFREINVDDAGVDGRGYNGTGWRYGAPHMDRRRGEVKIPTRID